VEVRPASLHSATKFQVSINKIQRKASNVMDYATKPRIGKDSSGNLPAGGALRMILVAGLITRQGRRINHPQAPRQSGKLRPILIKQAFCLYDHASGCGSGTKPLDGKTPPRVLTGARFAVARSALTENSVRVTRMIYQFLIASPGRKLAELSRIRVVSAFGRTEAEARAHLAGLHLVFLSRTPARKGGAA
jgi:hypothetical protein